MNTTAINIEAIYLQYKVLVHFYTTVSFFPLILIDFFSGATSKERLHFSAQKLFLDISIVNAKVENDRNYFLFVTKFKKKNCSPVSI